MGDVGQIDGDCAARSLDPAAIGLSPGAGRPGDIAGIPDGLAWQVLHPWGLLSAGCSEIVQLFLLGSPDCNPSVPSDLVHQLGLM